MDCNLCLFKEQTFLFFDTVKCCRAGVVEDTAELYITLILLYDTHNGESFSINA